MPLLDWDNPPELESPKRRARDQYDRERLARAALRRRKHKPSKAHATGKRNAAIRAAKKKRIERKVSERETWLAEYRAQVRAYWRGEIDEHPA